MSDDTERSVASAGSHGLATAWGVFYGDEKLHSSWDSHAKAECTALTMRKFDQLGVYVSPLYRFTLTDAERALVKKLTWQSYDDRMGRSIWVTPDERRTAEAMLERLGDTPAANATPGEGSKQVTCTLTDEERAALEWAEDASNTTRASAIRGLLNRTK
jgi:hypothetical protein